MTDSTNTGSSASSKGTIVVNDYLEIFNENKKYILGIGHIEGTNDLHISLKAMIIGPSLIYPSEGVCRNETIESTRYINGYYSLSKDTSIPLRDRYIGFLKKQYEDSVLVREELHPFVKDFECIVGKKKNPFGMGMLY